MSSGTRSAPAPAATTAPNAVVARGIGVRFGAVQAVAQADLEIATGEAFGIVGESGSGKSTLIRVLAGLTPGWDGTLQILGETVAPRRSRSRLLRRDVQMVFQDPYGSLHPRHTVYATLAEPLVVHGIGDRATRIAEVLEAVQLPASLAHRYPNQMSGGQRQRVAIARALITRPRIVLLDEPTSALDVSVQAEILALLSRLRQELGLTYVFVSHDLAIVARLCDRVAIMQSGRIVERIAADGLARGSVGHPYSIELLKASRGYARMPAQTDAPEPKLLLEVRNLRVTIPTSARDVEAVRGISFEVRADRLGIVGESGSGKSVTGRALLGLAPPGARVRAERLRLGDLDLLDLDDTALERIRGRRIAMVLQDPRFSLNPVMSVGEQLDEVSLLHRHCSAEQARARSLEMLEAVHIRDGSRVCGLFPHELSGGMGQRVMIAMMLAADPDLLVADEATSALDVRTQIEVLAVLDELIRTRSLGLVFISHDLRLVRSFCDRVAVMSQGEIVEQGPVALLESPTHPYTRRLLAAAPTLESDAARATGSPATLAETHPTGGPDET
jgi:peptide/nickel transport system ATP-binding protein